MGPFVSNGTVILGCNWNMFWFRSDIGLKPRVQDLLGRDSEWSRRWDCYKAVKARKVLVKLWGMDIRYLDM